MNNTHQTTETRQALKQKAIKQFQLHEKDNGSMEYQVINLHFDIQDLTDNHAKIHRKDFAAKRSIVKWVAKLNSCKAYIKKHNPAKYISLIQALGMRK